MLNMTDFKMYPKDKGKMVSEIRRAFDEYDADNISDVDFISLMQHYQEYSQDEGWLGQYEPDFRGGEPVNDFKVSRSTRDRLGKSRTKRLEKMLSNKEELM